MKKSYQKPELKCFQVELLGMLNLSLPSSPTSPSVNSAREREEFYSETMGKEEEVDLW